jgi:hypothetical protein
MESRETPYLGLRRQSEARTAAFGRLVPPSPDISYLESETKDELVAQISESAVSPISQSAGRRNVRSVRRFGNSRYSRLGSLRYNLRMKYPARGLLFRTRVARTKAVSH